VSDWTLHLGDCLDPVTGLASLADLSVDVTVSDPPFESEAHTKQRRVKSGGRCETESLPFGEITADQRASIGLHIGRVTKRWALVFCQVEASVKWALACEAGGLEYVRTMVWVKPDAMPQYTGDRPGMGYESIVVCHPRGRKRWNGGGRSGVFIENKNAGRPNGEAAPHPTFAEKIKLLLALVEAMEVLMPLVAARGANIPDGIVPQARMFLELLQNAQENSRMEERA
jgi:site-specific DNA-methyltransferase (adenine-specific)